MEKRASSNHLCAGRERKSEKLVRDAGADSETRPAGQDLSRR